jgi:hypothetical protein
VQFDVSRFFADVPARLPHLNRERFSLGCGYSFLPLYVGELKAWKR